jgi:hypothetical protein
MDDLYESGRKFIVIRLNDPRVLSDFINDNWKRCENTYTLSNSDLIFPCVIISYDRFILGNLYLDQYISSWELVSGIDANIYLYEKSGIMDDRWSEIDEAAFEVLGKYLRDFERDGSDPTWVSNNLLSYYNMRRRDWVINGLGL